MSPLRSRHRRSRLAAATLLPAILAGCAVGPDYQAPAPPSVGTYTAEPQSPSTASAPGNAGATQHFNPSADVPAQWWSLFQSPQLDRMVREALDHSPTLAEAMARLKEVQEEANARTGATKYPTVSGNASIEGEQVNLAAFGIPIQNPPPFALHDESVDVS